ncbi:MAG: hypothetical protein Q8N34_03205 [Gammaproteobacteria bacterium]|nr:hypothetical protein [Gammaproteobacteria bacterium]
MSFNIIDQSPHVVPMVPPTASEAFQAVSYTGNGSARSITGGVDAATNGGIVWIKSTGANIHNVYDTERGPTNYFNLDLGGNGVTNANTLTAFNSNGFNLGTDAIVNANAQSFMAYCFMQGYKFLDVISYTGTSGVLDLSHSLGALPGMCFFKRIGAAERTYVFHKDAGSFVSGNTYTKGLATDETWEGQTSTRAFLHSTWSSTTTLTINSDNSWINSNGATRYCYAFAAETSDLIKCGTYTGTAATLQINCGFTGNARFVLIKRIDAAGEWYLFDATRGIVSGNDPYFLITTAAQITGTDYIDPYTTGFELSAAGSATVNISGGVYVYMAIA